VHHACHPFSIRSIQTSLPRTKLCPANLQLIRLLRVCYSDATIPFFQHRAERVYQSPGHERTKRTKIRDGCTPNFTSGPVFQASLSSFHSFIPFSPACDPIHDSVPLSSLPPSEPSLTPPPTTFHLTASFVSSRRPSSVPSPGSSHDPSRLLLTFGPICCSSIILSLSLSHSLDKH
jgi:hypothetical protein